LGTGILVVLDVEPTDVAIGVEPTDVAIGDVVTVVTWACSIPVADNTVTGLATAALLANPLEI
jgi:hypothetical protein